MSGIDTRSIVSGAAEVEAVKGHLELMFVTTAHIGDEAKAKLSPRLPEGTPKMRDGVPTAKKRV